MAYSAHSYVGDSTDAPLTINFTLGFLNRGDVHAYVEDEETERTITWVNDGLITIGVVTTGLAILIRRETVTGALAHDYSNGAVITEAHLDNSNLQNIMLVHEILDGFRDEGFEHRGNEDFGGYRIINLGNGIADTDAATTGQMNAVLTSVAADVVLVNQAVDDAEAQVVLAADQVALATAQVALAVIQVGLAEDEVALAIAQVVLATAEADAAAADAILAAASEAKAALWAGEDEDVEVETGKYSAKHWALKAAALLDTKEDVLGDPTFDGYILASTTAGVRSWIRNEAGAKGGSDTNAVFFENDTNVTADYTITTDKNAMSAGPITIDSGKTVTVPTGSVWTVV